MNYLDIETWDTKELRNILHEMGLPLRRNRKDMITDILEKKDADYVRGKQLGEPGKDAITYQVNKKYALKQYKSRKSANQILKEANMQKLLASVNACPKVIDVDLHRKYILMDKLDKHLIDVNSEKSVSLDHQKQLVKLYDKLDEVGVFHGDANPLNYMTKGKKLYVIDFGMSKTITPSLIKKLGSETPNRDIMTVGMIFKLKAMHFPEDSYKYLIESLPANQRTKFNL